MYAGKSSVKKMEIVTAASSEQIFLSLSTGVIQFSARYQETMQIAMYDAR